MSEPRYTASTITDEALDQLYERAEQAEAALRLVLGVAEVIEANGIKWAADSVRRAAGGCVQCGGTGACNGGPCPLHTEPAEHVGNGANAEDCPACAGTNPPYPFICPGPKESSAP
ncbi:hypothetical protein [Streptomyces sp. KR55]|uniref:hypothetical protein n=1 Tax=Streptomyces sp. KR55 TaxID=3457425 RepID=UPI003FD621BA